MAAGVRRMLTPNAPFHKVARAAITRLPRAALKDCKLLKELEEAVAERRRELEEGFKKGPSRRERLWTATLDCMFRFRYGMDRSMYTHTVRQRRRARRFRGVYFGVRRAAARAKPQRSTLLTRRARPGRGRCAGRRRCSSSWASSA